jgi:hypothetical protein
MKRRSREISVFSISALDIFASALGAFVVLAIYLFPFYNEENKFLRKFLVALEEIETLNEVLDDERTARAEVESNLEDAEADLEDETARAVLAEEALTETEERLAHEEANRLRLEDEARELTATISDLEDEKDDAIDAIEDLEARQRATLEQMEQLERLLAVNFLIIVIEWTEREADVDLAVWDNEDRRFWFSGNNRNGRTHPEARAQLSFDAVRGPGLELWQDTEAEEGEYRIQIRYFNDRSGATPKPDLTIFTRDGEFSINVPQLSAENRIFDMSFSLAEDGTVDIDGALLNGE